MLRQLIHKRAVRCWAVKQIDSEFLHLCSLAKPKAKGKGNMLKEELRNGTFEGGLKMETGGMLLNARLFEALIPRDDLVLIGDSLAYWKERHWKVAHVPQHCWTWEGRLVVEEQSSTHSPCFVSREDTSFLKVDKTPSYQPSKAFFLPHGPLDQSYEDLHEKVRTGQESRRRFTASTKADF